MKFVLLIPTPAEAAPFIETVKRMPRTRVTEKGACNNAVIVSEGRHPYVCVTDICGIGPVSAAAAAAGTIASERPDTVVLGGIAGAYPLSGFQAGSCVSVITEHAADLGSIRNGGFVPLRQPQVNGAAARIPKNSYSLDRIPGGTLPEVASNTVCCCSTPWLDPSAQPAAAVENMEGAAVAAVCEACGTACYELRAISNIVGDRPALWRTEEAARTLAAELIKLLEILAGHDNLRIK